MDELIEQYDQLRAEEETAGVEYDDAQDQERIDQALVKLDDIQSRIEYLAQLLLEEYNVDVDVLEIQRVKNIPQGQDKSESDDDEECEDEVEYVTSDDSCVDILDDSAIDELKPHVNKRQRINVFTEEDDIEEREAPSCVLEVDLAIENVMKPHQRDAYKKIISNYRNDRTGFLLAHAMGLGKTLTSIAFLQYVFASTPNAKVVVISPKSLCANWYAELDKWQSCISFPFYSPIDDACDPNVRVWTKKGGVLIMTLDRFRLETNKPDGFKTDVLVVDEAHLCKSKESEIFKAVQSSVCLFKLLVTGSPLQNHLGEYFTMMRMIDKNVLSEEFEKECIKAIDTASSLNATPQQVALGKRKLNVFNCFTNQFVDRRTNAILKASLPPMYEYKLMYATDKKDYEGLGTFEEMNQVMIDTNPDKIEKASVLIKHILQETGDQIIIFAKRKDTLEQLKGKHHGLYFDGTNSTHERESYVSDFNDGTSRILYMTFGVGSVGLNLYSANRVLLLDPNWNPAIDSQACFRAYRYGQVKTVFIYRFIAQDTIEDAMYKLAVHKNTEACRIIDDKKIDRQFSKEQLKTHICDFKEHLVTETEDEVLNAVLNHFESCAQHDVLFAGAENDKLTEAEQADAENETNKIMRAKYESKTKPSPLVYVNIKNTKVKFDKIWPEFEEAIKYQFEVENSERVLDYDADKVRNGFSIKIADIARIRCRAVFDNTMKTEWSDWSAQLIPDIK